jgi:tetratricopeptide (TPR) repeat protein
MLVRGRMPVRIDPRKILKISFMMIQAEMSHQNPSGLNAKRTRMTRCSLPVMLFSLLLWGAGLRPACGQESIEKFIESLKERRYYDTAAAYLDSIQSSPLLTTTFREKIPFEKARLLIDSANSTRDAKRRDREFDEAQQLLSDFIKNLPTHPDASAARNSLAGLLLGRANLKLKQAARQKDVAAAEKLKLEARELYQQSSAVLDIARTEITEILKRLGRNPTDAKLKELQLKNRGQLLVVRRLQMTVLVNRAETYGAEDAERKKLLDEAVVGLDDYINDYRNFDDAQFARLELARCQEKLGLIPDASTSVMEVIGLPPTAQWRKLRLEAAQIGASIWLNKDPKQYRLAIEQIEPMLLQVPGSEERDDLVLEVRLALGKAYRGLLGELQAKTEKSEQDNKEITICENFSEKLVKEVSRYESSVQEEALQLLIDWKVRRAVEKTETDAPPATFVEAAERASLVLADYETAKTTLATLNASSENSAEKQQQIKDAEAQMQAAPHSAIKYLRQAIQMAKPDTPPEDLNGALYKLAYCYFITQDLERAAVLCEMLVYQQTASSFARPAADIGMVALFNLFAAAGKDSAFEAKHLTAFCEKTMQSWPKDEQAAKAARFLIQLAVVAGDIARAEELLAKIPADAPGRSMLDVQTGLGAWQRFQRLTFELEKSKKDNLIDEATAKTQQAELLTLRTKAEQWLSDGLAKVDPNKIDTNVANAALAFAQLLNDANRPDQALAQLENPVYGPLQLVKQNHPALTNPEFPASVHQACIQAQLGTLSTTSDVPGTILKAQESIQGLKASVPNDEEGKKKLVAIFFRLAGQIKRQLDQLESPTARAAYAKGLLAFIDEVQQGSSDISVLTWAADTNSSVGETLERDGNATQANELYTKSVQAYESIMAIAKKDPSAISAPQLAAVQQQLAAAYRKAGQFDKAMAMLIESLKATPGSTTAQFDAARTLHDWGIATKDKAKLRDAMQGIEPITDAKTKRTSNLVWGWGGLSQRLGAKPELRDKFFVARIGLAETRLEYARLHESKQKELEKAETEIMQAKRAYPDLGGPVVSAKFELILKTIQKELGKAETGFGSTPK